MFCPEGMVPLKATFSAGGDGGFKSLMITRFAFSNSTAEVVVNNREYRGFPLFYYQDGVAFAQADQLRSTPCNSANFAFAPAIDAGTPTTINTCADYESRYGVLYQNPVMPNNGIPSQGTDIYAAGFPSPYAQLSGETTWRPDDWLNIYMIVTIGTLGTASSRVRMYASRYGDADKLIIDAQNIQLGSANGGHDGIWLTPYDTNRD